ncbi:hypothetical protein AMTR_s00032p00188690 [Amborella trichopoda]|uniref:Uncharacterized protein n=1 Tax=Amborella trichopoda TaxID=13333 RepID=U5CP26_AMBTC|nr:hypothetical protein AMTR_s00032p00188690 [Amborella trichopoda]
MVTIKDLEAWIWCLGEEKEWVDVIRADFKAPRLKNLCPALWYDEVSSCIVGKSMSHTRGEFPMSNFSRNFEFLQAQGIAMSMLYDHGG